MSRIWLVETVSFSRLVAALLFALVAFRGVPITIVAVLYLSAMVSDLVDGYLARRLNVETHFGKVIDLVSDKSLTLVSLLYAASCGIDILPLALIAIREIITIGARSIIVHGAPLLPTNKILGGIMWTVLWGNTLSLVILGREERFIKGASIVYWICAIVLTWNLIVRIYGNAQRIKMAVSENQ